MSITRAGFGRRAAAASPSLWSGWGHAARVARGCFVGSFRSGVVDGSWMDRGGGVVVGRGQRAGRGYLAAIAWGGGGGGSGGIGRAVVDFFFVLFGVVEDFSFDSAASSVGVDRAPTDWFHFSVIVSLFF